MNYLKKIGKNSKKAFKTISSINHGVVKIVLNTYIKLILSNKKSILKENTKDVAGSKRKHLIDRLILNDARIKDMCESIEKIIKFKDPLNKE